MIRADCRKSVLIPKTRCTARRARHPHPRGAPLVAPPVCRDRCPTRRHVRPFRSGRADGGAPDATGEAGRIRCRQRHECCRGDQAHRQFSEARSGCVFATSTDQSCTEQALAVLLDIYLIAHTITSAEADPNKLLEELKLTASEELQARCAGYIEAEVERHAELLAEQVDEDGDASPGDRANDDEESSGSDTETESNQRNKKKKAKGKGKKGKGNADAPAVGQFKLRSASQLRGDLLCLLLCASRVQLTLGTM